MLKKEKIDRINHLAKKSKGEEGLTEEEKKEQEQLRKEYIEKFREHFKGHLNRVKFVEDLSEEELAKIQKENAQIQKEKREKRTKLVCLRQREASRFSLFLFYHQSSKVPHAAGGKQGNMEKRYLKWILITAAVCIIGLALTGAAGTHEARTVKKLLEKRSAVMESVLFGEITYEEGEKQLRQIETGRLYTKDISALREYEDTDLERIRKMDIVSIEKKSRIYDRMTFCIKIDWTIAGMDGVENITREYLAGVDVSNGDYRLISFEIRGESLLPTKFIGKISFYARNVLQSSLNWYNIVPEKNVHKFLYKGVLS
ncbi:MAG: DUF896 domain-containing protein [Clostridia bacterium]